jgi:hypothetical protein
VAFIFGTTYRGYPQSFVFEIESLQISNRVRAVKEGVFQADKQLIKPKTLLFCDQSSTNLKRELSLSL